MYYIFIHMYTYKNVLFYVFMYLICKKEQVDHMVLQLSFFQSRNFNFSPCSAYRVPSRTHQCLQTQSSEIVHIHARIVYKS